MNIIRDGNIFNLGRGEGSLSINRGIERTKVVFDCFNLFRSSGSHGCKFYFEKRVLCAEYLTSLVEAQEEVQRNIISMTNLSDMDEGLQVHFLIYKTLSLHVESSEGRSLPKLIKEHVDRKQPAEFYFNTQGVVAHTAGKQEVLVKHNQETIKQLEALSEALCECLDAWTSNYETKKHKKEIEKTDAKKTEIPKQKPSNESREALKKEKRQFEARIEEHRASSKKEKAIEEMDKVTMEEHRLFEEKLRKKEEL